MSETYSMPCHCTNCGQDNQFEIPKGQERPTEPVECPHCGCKTATVNQPAIKLDLPDTPWKGPTYPTFPHQPILHQPEPFDKRKYHEVWCGSPVPVSRTVESN